MPYPLVYPWIELCLQERSEGIDLETFDPVIASVIRRTLKPYPEVSYEALTGSDLDAISEAVGYRTAARVHGEFLTGGVSVSLKSEDDGEFKRAFDGSLPDKWEGNALRALNDLSFYTPPRGTRFAVSGPSRSRCKDAPSEYWRYGGYRWP